MNYKTIVLPLCFLSTGAIAAMNYGTVELTHLKPTKSESTWLREKQFVPRYPVELAKKGVVGCGVFKVKVDENGATQNVSLISSVPEKVISKPAGDVIRDWSWKLAEGKTPASEEKLLRLDFCLGGSSQKEAASAFKQQASLACE